MLTLYHCDTSYTSQIVRLYIFEYNIPCVFKHIDLRKQENITTKYREINPKGTVPCLVDEDKTIIGSTDIMDYVTKQLISSIPTDSELYGQIFQFCKAFEGIHDPYIRLLSYTTLFKNKIKENNPKVERLLKLAKQHPWKERGKFLTRIINSEIPEDEIQASKDLIKEKLLEIDSKCQIKKTTFFFSDYYSMADAAVTAFIFRVIKLGFDIQCFPNLNAYYQALTQRNNFRQAKIQ